MSDAPHGNIRILATLVADQIAAGEVVERPASVAKELLENSIDAGATTIQLDIESGGVKRVRVFDNGSGMSPQDLPTAFIRHATSKISALEDLDDIHTCGFRGEALPAIASVSKLCIRTRAPRDKSPASSSAPRAASCALPRKPAVPWAPTSKCAICFSTRRRASSSSRPRAPRGDTAPRPWCGWPSCARTSPLK